LARKPNGALWSGTGDEGRSHHRGGYDGDEVQRSPPFGRTSAHCSALQTLSQNERCEDAEHVRETAHARQPSANVVWRKFGNQRRGAHGRGAGSHAREHPAQDETHGCGCLCHEQASENHRNSRQRESGSSAVPIHCQWGEQSSDSPADDET